MNANRNLVLAIFLDDETKGDKALPFYREGIRLLQKDYDNIDDDDDILMKNKIKKKIGIYNDRLKQLNISAHSDRNPKCTSHDDKQHLQFCYGCREWFCCLCSPQKCKHCCGYVHNQCFFKNVGDACGIHYSLKCLFDQELTTFMFPLRKTQSILDVAKELMGEAFDYERRKDELMAIYYYDVAFHYFKISLYLEKIQIEKTQENMTKCFNQIEILNNVTKK